MNQQQLELSLVICTYNRDKYLPEALESIKTQTLPVELFECIIVDNRSTDSTEAIVKRFIKENPSYNIRYVFESNKGLSFARNRGIAEAATSIICYVDDDTILSADYLKEIMAFFKTNTGAIGVGGKVIPKYESGKEPEWMNKYLNGFVGKVDHGEMVLQYNDKMKYPAGCNMIYKKEILLKAGGFNNNLKFRSDDKYIFYKIKAVSDKIYYVPGAWLYHYIDSYRLSPENFRKLFLKTGNEEKIRISDEKNKAALFQKFSEYLVKFFASFIIYFIFILKGEEIKGRYVLSSQWYTLKGFLQKKVFVR